MLMLDPHVLHPFKIENTFGITLLLYMHFLFPWVSCTNQRDTVQASSVGLLDYLVPGFWQGLNNIRISDLTL